MIEKNLELIEFLEFLIWFEFDAASSPISSDSIDDIEIFLFLSDEDVFWNVAVEAGAVEAGSIDIGSGTCSIYWDMSTLESFKVFTGAVAGTICFS